MGLAVQSCGMVTAIGLDALSACAAMRAGLDNFAETRFIARDGNWILGSEVPLPEGWRGIERLAQLLAAACDECRKDVEIDFEAVPVLLCLAENERPGRIADLETQLWQKLSEKLGVSLSKESRAYAYGQVGGFVALHDARRLLEEGAPAVLIAGVDTFLVSETLRKLSDEDRLLTESNSNGFIAGEAGAAVLVAGKGDLYLKGLGFGAEEAHISSEKPLRADGLTKAIKDALGEAGIVYDDISYRIADIAGESYYFREAALAQTRIWRGERDPEEVWQPSSGIGHTGAAVVPLSLGMALIAARKDYAPGPTVLIHGSHDDGRRAAMVVEAV